MFEKTRIEDIIHLLPQDSWIVKEIEWNNEILQNYALFYEGNLELSKLDLDYSDYEEDISCYVVQGNLKVENIYNDDTDGALGLIVLGNLEADNIMVGGQELYITGNLQVDGLFFGDYNHGNLHVDGMLQARVFLTYNEYGCDIERVLNEDNIHIQKLLTYEENLDKVDFEINRRVLQGVFKSLFILNIDSEASDCWAMFLDLYEIKKAVKNNQSVLLDKFTQGEFNLFPFVDFPSFFENDKINESNLLCISNSDFWTKHMPHEEGSVTLEYWDGNICRRIFLKLDEPFSIAVYFQHGDRFATMLYFGPPADSAKGDSEPIFSKAYKYFDEEETWLTLDDDSPVEILNFVEENWKILLYHYSEIVHNANRFEEIATKDKVEYILSLPTVKDEYSDYYDDEGEGLWDDDFQYQFRQKENECNACPRITIIRDRGDDEYDIFHYDLEESEGGALSLNLYSQDEDGYSFDTEKIPFSNRVKMKNAIRFFERMEEYILEDNDLYIC